MSLKGILSISGMTGLFKVVTQTKSGTVVESLTDKKRTVVDATHKISMLDDISIFTTAEDKPLVEILRAIKEKTSDELPVSGKSTDADLKKYFKTVVPDYDEERVYVSHIKKIISWYPLLKDMLAPEETESQQKYLLKMLLLKKKIKKTFLYKISLKRLRIY